MTDRNLVWLGETKHKFESHPHELGELDESGGLVMRTTIAHAVGGTVVD
jgi:hypothetical protein